MVVLMLAGISLLVWAGVENFHTRKLQMQAAREKAAQQATLVKDGSTPVATTGGDDSPLGKDLRGKAAPAFTLVSVTGKKVSLADFKGRPMVINFWATYCGPCKLEMPWFEEFSKKYADKHLQILGIDDEDGVTKEQVAEAARKAGVSYPILMDTSANASAYGLGDYLPVTFYIDAKGNVVDQTPGAPSKEQMEATIQKILGGI
jgi:thiol-disulfide isomerase/thioredoxin